MPTPIQHLVVARELLRRGGLPAHLDNCLTCYSGAHLLGHIAPDAQNKSGQRREETHFFRLPAGDQPPACSQMLAAHPALARASALQPEQAVFMAGYLAHLLLDELWIRRIYEPYFGLGARHGTLGERALIHNVLRTWLDRRELARLGGDEGDALRRTVPRQWSPFITDEALCAWRDEIAGQLYPAPTLRTVEVFAARMGVSVEAFNDILADPAAMQQRVFVYAPQGLVAGFVDEALQEIHDMIVAYLEERLCRS